MPSSSGESVAADRDFFKAVVENSLYYTGRERGRKAEQVEEEEGSAEGKVETKRALHVARNCISFGGINSPAARQLIENLNGILVL